MSNRLISDPTISSRVRHIPTASCSDGEGSSQFGHNRATGAEGHRVEGFGVRS
jgi:hypothetical protein